MALPMVSSKVIADAFPGKIHRNVIRDISQEILNDVDPDFGALNFGAGLNTHHCKTKNYRAT